MVPGFLSSNEQKKYYLFLWYHFREKLPKLIYYYINIISPTVLLFYTGSVAEGSNALVLDSSLLGSVGSTPTTAIIIFIFFWYSSILYSSRVATNILLITQSGTIFGATVHVYIYGLFTKMCDTLFSRKHKITV